MKQVHPNYTFNASTKTITLTGLNIEQDQLLLVTNATRGVVYYNFASSSLRATVTAGANTSVVLLDASTTGHSNNDQLVIHYENQSATQPVSGTINAVTNIGTNEIAEGIRQYAEDPEFNLNANAIGYNYQENSPAQIPIRFDGSDQNFVAIGPSTDPIPIPVSISGTAQISANSLPLPSGAATSANQSTTNTSLGSINNKIPSLVNNRIPVDIASGSSVGSFFMSGLLGPTANGNTYTAIDVNGFDWMFLIATQGSSYSNNWNGHKIIWSNTSNFSTASTEGSIFYQQIGASWIKVSNFSSLLLSDDYTNPPTTGYIYGRPVGVLAVPVLGRYFKIVSPGSTGDQYSLTFNYYLKNGNFYDTPVLSLGNTTDSSATTDTGTFSLISLFKRLLSKLPSLTAGNRIPVDGSGVTQPVSGTFWQTTQPVSGSISVSNFPATQPVSGTFWQTTQPVSGTVTANTGLAQPLTDTQLRATAVPVSTSSLPLPSGASTETTLSALNTKIPSLTVSSARLLVDGSGVTQPTSDRGATGEATVTSYSSTTSTTLKASNANRKLLTIYNEGAGNLHILYGNGTASTTNYSVKLATGDYLEVDKYTGQLTAIFASAGTARITEIT